MKTQNMIEHRCLFNVQLYKYELFIFEHIKSVIENREFLKLL